MATQLRHSLAALWSFRQLRAVFLLALAIVLLMPGMTVVWVFPAFTSLLVANTEEDARHDATLLATELTQALDSLSVEGLARSPQALELLRQAEGRLGASKLRLFAANGEILYSSDPAEVGKIHAGSVFRDVVAHGRPYSKLEREGDISADGEEATRSMVETYIPIARSGRFDGAFEIYIDVTARESLQGALLTRASLALLAVGLGLLGFLIYVLFQASQAMAQRSAAEASLRETATVFQASYDAIIITDPDGNIRRVNPAFTEITGYTAEDVLGKTPRVLKSGRHDARFYERFWDDLRRLGHWEGEIFNRRKDGTIYPQWGSVTAIRDPAGNLTGYVSQFSDVARRKLTEEEIRQRANYDALTGLPNRVLLVERLEWAILEADRQDQRVAVLFIDLDDFKRINDIQGHQVGDEILQEAAVYLKSCVRSMDTVARPGGDEFVVLLPNIDHSLQAAEVAGKIVARFRQGFSRPDLNHRLTASVGVAIYPDDGRDVYTLFRHADLAMYRAKEQGRDSVQFYEPAMTEVALYRHRLETDLRQALERGELAMHYQPIFSLTEDRMVGVEALMRWRHPERGMVPPDQFIPLAEDTGLIRELGAWALDTVCAQLAIWRARGLALYAAVNLSGRQIPDDQTPDRLAGLVARHGLLPSALLLEITEGVLLKDADKAQAWVRAVRDMGFRVALDDFGTGYSSLSYLKRLDLDVVKVDKSFVGDMDTDPGDRALVETIIAMGHLLGLQVVAEGIETASHLAQLKTMRCDYAQGYHLSRPLPADEIPARAAAGSSGEPQARNG